MRPAINRYYEVVRNLVVGTMSTTLQICVIEARSDSAGPSRERIDLVFPGEQR